MNNIYRGDIYYIDNAKYVDATVEGSPARPAVIVSNNKCNAFSGDVTVVFLTSSDSRPDLPTHVPVLCKQPQPSTAMCESVSMVSTSRIGNYIRTCTSDEMKAIDKALKIQLAVEDTAEGVVRDENIRLKAALDVYKGLVEKLLPQLV